MAPRRNNTNHHHSHHQHSTGGVGSGGGGIGPVVDVQSLLGLGDLALSSVNNSNSSSSSSNNNINHNDLHNNNNNLTVLGNSLNFDFHSLQNMTSSSTTSSSMINNNNNNNNNQSMNSSMSENFTRCCVPIGECFKQNLGSDFGLIGLDDLSECVRVICNNENCTVGQYMHRECFESWEQSVLQALKSIGRARSWSDRQRQQNLWTKKGYDLVYKACNCKCSRGHLKKDLDWTPPPINNNIFGRADEEAIKKKKKRNRNNQKPTLAIASLNSNGYHPNSKILNGGNNNCNSNTLINNGGVIMEQLRGRTGSLSSSSGSTSPPVSASSEHSISPIHNNGNLIVGNKKSSHHHHHHEQQQMSPQQQSIYQQHHQMQQQHNLQLNVQQLQKTKVEIYSERVRSTSGCNGIFSRRLDFSSFNQLPKTRLNSYQVKMEDEGNHGNDETRLFILSSLAQSQKSRVNCILCEDAMLVFDRYPLVDGSFFLSPKQHAPGCIEVKYEGRVQYLTAVCMGCLDGNSCSRVIGCRFCGKRWDGSSLVLGTMYSYDIFAAMPCCAERLKCNACFKLLLHPEQRLNFYSDYTHCVTCPYCTTQDTHFVKPLAHCYTKLSIQAGVQLP